MKKCETCNKVITPLDHDSYCLDCLGKSVCFSCGKDKLFIDGKWFCSCDLKEG